MDMSLRELYFLTSSPHEYSLSVADVHPSDPDRVRDVLRRLANEKEMELAPDDDQLLPRPPTPVLAPPTPPPTPASALSMLDEPAEQAKR